MNRGVADEKMGALDAAIADFTEVIVLKPGFAPAYSSRGRVYAAKGALDDAIADYKRALVLEGDSVKAYYYRSRAYDQMARRDREKAVELDPDFVVEEDEDLRRPKPAFGGSLNKRWSDGIFEAGKKLWRKCKAWLLVLLLRLEKLITPH
jgi:tetratricopeptide (TPR) repeat protein